MKVGVVGYGYVGRSMHKVFPEALVYDYYNLRKKGWIKIQNRYGFTDTDLLTDKGGINGCDAVIVSVPTPTAKDGWSCDTKVLSDVLKWLMVPLVVIKSTVPPGTCRGLNKDYRGGIVFSPEFAGEGGYFSPDYRGYPNPTDSSRHEFLVLGGEPDVTKRAYDLFIGKVGPAVRIVQATWEEAEAMKYLDNILGATKVTLANEFFECLEVMGIDYRKVRELMLLDKRVSEMHTAVFPRRGFSGKCYPKDLRAFIRHSEGYGYDPRLLKEVLRSNNRIRKDHGFKEV